MEPEIKKVKSKGKLFYPITHVDAVIGLENSSDGSLILDSEDEKHYITGIYKPYVTRSNGDIIDLYKETGGSLILGNPSLMDYVEEIYIDDTLIPKETWISYQTYYTIIPNLNLTDKITEYNKYYIKKKGYNLSDYNLEDDGYELTGDTNEDLAHYGLNDSYSAFTSLKEKHSFKIIINKDIPTLGSLFNRSNAYEINLSNLGKLSEVTSMEYMFAGCTCEKVIIKNIDFPKLWDLSSMFQGANSLVELDWDNIKFSKDTLICMSNMFYTCYMLKDIDLSIFEGYKINGSSFELVFYECQSLTTLDLRPLNIVFLNYADEYIDLVKITHNCISLEILYLTFNNLFDDMPIKFKASDNILPYRLKRLSIPDKLEFIIDTTDSYLYDYCPTGGEIFVLTTNLSSSSNLIEKLNSEKSWTVDTQHIDNNGNILPFFITKAI